MHAKLYRRGIKKPWVFENELQWYVLEYNTKNNRYVIGDNFGFYIGKQVDFGYSDYTKRLRCERIEFEDGGVYIFSKGKKK